MKKTMKRSLILFLAVLLLSAAWGCTPSEVGKEETEGAVTAARQETADPTGEPAVTDVKEETTDGTGTTAGDMTVVPPDTPPDGSEGLEYRKDGNSYTVTGIGTCADAVLTVPSYHLGYPVTAIDDRAFSGCEFLTSVTIPDSVTDIGGSIFSGCRALEALDLPFLPNGVLHSVFEKYYAEDTFSGLGEGTAVDFDFMDSFEEEGFCVCDLSTEQDGAAWIVIPEALRSVSVRGGDISGVTVTTHYYERVDTWVVGAFEGFSGLTSVTLPDDMEYLPDTTFMGCDSLSFHTENGMTFLSSQSSPCAVLIRVEDKGMTSFTVPEGVRAIDAYVFRNCEKLRSVDLPETLRSIGDCCFYGCSSLAECRLPAGLTYLGSGCFNNCTSLVRCDLPKGLISLGDGCFAGCKALEECVLPEGLTCIGDSCFSGCTVLTGCILPDGLQSIGYGAFRDCSSLTGLLLPEGIRTIGAYAFGNCSSLKELHLPESVTNIGSGAFEGCASLTKLNVPKLSPDSAFAFQNCPPALCQSSGGVSYIDSDDGSVRYFVGFAPDAGTVCTVPEGITALYLDFDRRFDEIRIPASVRTISGDLSIAKTYIFDGTSDQWEDAVRDCISEYGHWDDFRFDIEITVICADKTIDGWSDE